MYPATWHKGKGIQKNEGTSQSENDRIQTQTEDFEISVQANTRSARVYLRRLLKPFPRRRSPKRPSPKGKELFSFHCDQQ